jgi:cysteine desulfurase
MKIKSYLDNAATTPLDSRVLAAMLPYLKDGYGNASSIHSLGQAAKTALENSRKTIADFIGAKPEEIAFTSGGTEADNFVIKQVAAKNPGGHIIISAIEHDAVLNPCKFLEKNGLKVTYLKVNNEGLVDLKEIEKSISDDTILISVMQANNEIGTVEPIQEIGQIVKKVREERKSRNIETPIYLHTDAVQTFGHLPLEVNDLGADFLSASAHKLYGPKGVGMLYHRAGIKLDPLIHGGGHESGWRSGTENVPGVVGFARAVELAKKEMVGEYKRLTEWREKLIQGLEKITDVTLNGHRHLRLPNNVNISVKGVEGEAVLLYLDKRGIACSTGSACSSHSLKPSHVLLALGKSAEEAHSSLRFTTGRFTKKGEIKKLLRALPEIINYLRKMSPTWQEGLCNKELHHDECLGKSDK